MPALARIRVAATAASEMDVQLEVVEVGDPLWPLLAQWTGTAVVVYDAEHALHLAEVALQWANGVDDQAEEGEGSEPRRTTRAIATGLYTLADRLRLAAGHA